MARYKITSERRPSDPDAPPIPKRVPLTPYLEKILLKHRFAALCVMGPCEPVSRKLGDNLGGWPIKLGTTICWRENLTATLDTDAYHWRGVIMRLWCPSKFLADLLEEQVANSLRGTKARLRKSWYEFGPDFPLAKFEAAVRLIAEDCTVPIQVWDDAEMIKHLEALAQDDRQHTSREFDRMFRDPPRPVPNISSRRWR